MSYYRDTMVNGELKRVKIAGSGNTQEKNVITIKMTENTTIGAGSVIPLNTEFNKIGTKLSLENGKVKIGKGISKVLVSANTTGDYASSYKRIFIRKNGSDIMGTFSANGDGSSYQLASLSPFIMNVEENDTIELYNNDNQFICWHFGTYMTVEAVASEPSPIISLSEAYPIGFVITTMTDTLPTAFTTGMTWERFAKGKTLVGVDENDTDFATAGNTGGEKTHTLTVNEMPKHSHYLMPLQGNGSTTAHGTNYSNNMGNSISSGVAGNDQPHNNLQPYITVYFWRRIA